MSVIGDTAQVNDSQSSSCPGGALVWETSKEGGGEVGATAPARPSADLLFLQSLDAKIKEMTEAGLIAASSPAPVASTASEPTARTSTTTQNAHQSLRVADLPSIDSTQTARPLTSLELEACEVSRWFVIELMHSIDQIDAARIPNLSIFEEYRLYSVAWREQDQPMYALRLGFFSSEIGAAAVVRYLDSYFPSAALRRVSIAEHERFADKLSAPSKEIGAFGKHLAVQFVNTPAGTQGASRCIE